MKIINNRWYANEDCVRAGNPEMVKEFVCDCCCFLPDSEREESGDEIAAHIVRSHNLVLDLADKQVPLSFLIEACDRATEQKALLVVSLNVIGDSGAATAQKQLELIKQAADLLKQARDCETNASY